MAEQASHLPDGSDSFSHSEFMALAFNTVSEIVKDPLLKDLHSEPSVEEVKSQIALEHGRAITISLVQLDEDNTVLSVVVPLKSKVKDLKNAIQRHITLKQTREKGTTYISWKYVWQTYWLIHDGEKLTDNEKTIKEYGIKNKAVITFAKRLRRK